MGMFARRGRTARKQALLDELDQAARKICAHPGCESAQPSNRPTPSLHCQRLPVAQFYPSFHVASPDPSSTPEESRCWFGMSRAELQLLRLHERCLSVAGIVASVGGVRGVR